MYLLARFALPLVAWPVTRMRAPLGPLPLAPKLALLAGGPRHLEGGRVLDPVAVAGAAVVAARQQATALATTGTGL